ncbi:hypothetical protein MA16_Dca017197 [Dendrobium catenatum]|uniref:Uncharacterized protein n=1 Tax=Dendrobium catenatum TaxID=906689 RepID=A0A2I0W2P0_9ASPA|nr:hypothetical protein MA16_Dca017197 [Dendrobium catenatum]
MPFPIPTSSILPLERLQIGFQSFSLHDFRLIFLPTNFRIRVFSFLPFCHGSHRLAVDFQHFLYHVPEIGYLSFHGGNPFLHRCLDLVHLPFKPFF